MGGTKGLVVRIIAHILGTAGLGLGTFIFVNF